MPLRNHLATGLAAQRPVRARHLHLVTGQAIRRNADLARNLLPSGIVSVPRSSERMCDLVQQRGPYLGERVVGNQVSR